MRKGQWLQIMLDKKHRNLTLIWWYFYTAVQGWGFVEQYDSRSPGKKEPLSYKHASKLRPKHSLRPYTKKKLTQNEYLISLWSAKIISGTKKRFIQLTLLSDTASQAVAADYEQPLAVGNFRQGDERN